MSKFLKITSSDGIERLINTDCIDSVKKIDEKSVSIHLKQGFTLNTDQTFEHMEHALSDKYSEKIASNLFNIWEILRARLH